VKKKELNKERQIYVKVEGERPKEPEKRKRNRAQK